MTRYKSVRIPVRRVPYENLPRCSPDNPFYNSKVGIFTTEEELVERYGSENLARWREEYSVFCEAFLAWRASHPADDKPEIRDQNLD